MEIGERIRLARLEAGLSQRQTCGEYMTRNMLSQIENGTAAPSLGTLQYLSRRLCKPVGWFFGEAAAPGRLQVDGAWQAYEAGDCSEAARILDSAGALTEFRDVPYLRTLVLLALADRAIREGRPLYAGKMLAWVEENPVPAPELLRKAALLRGRLPGESAVRICGELPSLDGELLLRAQAALDENRGLRAARLLDAAENQKDPQWLLLRGRACISLGEYGAAVPYFHAAEESLPRETAPCLELCYRELGDFRQAYLYACRQR